jgi:tetratricopeptide (TPR) repeat protein
MRESAMKRGARALFFDMQRLAIVVWLLALPGLALGGGASEVFQKVKDAIVVVKALDREGQEVSQGSGVVLPSGEVVTNHHVVEKGVTVTVVAKGRSALAFVVGQDPDRDLALLFVVGLDASPAQLGRTESLKVGHRVFAVGAPYGLELSISEGIVSQLRGKKPPIIQTTAAISPGSSGGGLFNEQGQLVGITSFYLKGGQGLNFAVPVEWVRELIAQSKKAEPPPAAKAPGRAQAPDSSSEPGRAESDTTWSSQAKALEAAQNWSGLLEHSKRWTKAQPGQPLAWYSLGIAYGELGRHQEAVDAFKEALRLKPDYAEAWNNLGTAYSHQGRHQEAIQACKEALRLKPDYPVAWHNLGVAHHRLDRYQEAIKAYKEAIRLKPDFAEAWNGLGAAYAGLRRWQDAIDVSKEAVRLKPDSPNAWATLGLAYWGLGNRSEALKAVKELRHYDPAWADELFNLIMGQ